MLGTDGPACSTLAQLFAAADRDSSVEETFWAVRSFLEAVAKTAPLAVVFDDIHWGYPTFLDLIEHITDWAREAPILVLCVARPELLDERAGWGRGALNATTISLEPLSDGECGDLIGNMLGRATLPDEARLRILAAAEGTPLFVEEMLSMLIDDGSLARDGDRWVATGPLVDLRVPPTIQALLAARLEQLTGDERAAIQRAAVCGKQFHVGALAALLDGDGREVRPALKSLVRRDLIQPDRSSLAGQDAFRFRHQLIRDAAYEAAPKALRAELHERFADWLEDVGKARVEEFEEILAYHLEAGSPTPIGTRTAGRGRTRAGAQGCRALCGERPPGVGSERRPGRRDPVPTRGRPPPRGSSGSTARPVRRRAGEPARPRPARRVRCAQRGRGCGRCQRTAIDRVDGQDRSGPRAADGRSDRVL